MIKQSTGRLYVAVIFLSLFLSSCSNDDPTPITPVGEKGYFIVNEGGWKKGNTSISFYDRETETVSNNIFKNANGVDLGDQAQSMTVHDGKGFIVVQNSAKIEVINKDDFTRIETITEDIVSPRYFVGLSSTKGYVSDWGGDGVTGTVKVMDLSTYKVTKTIPTGQGTNRLLLNGPTLYAVNAGGWGRDKTVKMIDTNTDEVIGTITIAGTDNPESLQQDSDGNIWIATKGYTKYDPDFNVVPSESTPGALIKIATDGTELQHLSFEGVGGPLNLNINTAGTQLYYRYKGAVYTMSTNATALPTAKFIDKNFYGLSVDPFDDTIIGCIAPSFIVSGSFEIHNTQGTLMDTHIVGIGPNGCTFK